MLWVYIAIIAFIVGMIMLLSDRSPFRTEDCFLAFTAITLIGLILTFFLSSTLDKHRVETEHKTYEVLSLADAGLVPPYGETDYGVYTEDGDVGFYCRMENGLIKYMEFSNVEIRVSDTKPRYERIEYDHKPGALRHFAINMYETDKIIYLPKDATIRPVMQSTVG